MTESRVDGRFASSDSPTAGSNEAVRCGKCDQPVPDHGDVVCVDCHAELLSALEIRVDTAEADRRDGHVALDEIGAAREESIGRVTITGRLWALRTRWDAERGELLAALREVVRLRLATDEGSLRVRADGMWDVATAAITKAVSAPERPVP